jgi:hypothetical protein
MPGPPPASPSRSPSSPSGGAATAAYAPGTSPSIEGTAAGKRKSKPGGSFSPSGMSVDVHVEQALSGGGRRAGSLWTTGTSPLAPPPKRERAQVDPFAGEDEAWASEDFLLTPDEEDYVGFLRTLWIAVLACALFWVVLALGAAQLFGAA